MGHGLGLYGIFPFDLGGGDPTVEGGSVIEAEHMAILDSLAAGWDTAENLEFFQEAYSDAIAVTMIWALNRRLQSWLIPDRMLESLRVWEESTGLRPSSDDSDVERRRRVAGKLRGLVNNAIGNIEQSVISVLGSLFEEITLVEPANVVAYWAAVNPGPPGFTWSTNRVILGVKMKKEGLTDAAFIQKRQTLTDQLDTMCPIWMSFRIGVGDSFIINQGIIGQTFL